MLRNAPASLVPMVILLRVWVRHPPLRLADFEFPAWFVDDPILGVNPVYEYKRLVAGNWATLMLTLVTTVVVVIGLTLGILLSRVTRRVKGVRRCLILWLTVVRLVLTVLICVSTWVSRNVRRLLNWFANVLLREGNPPCNVDWVKLVRIPGLCLLLTRVVTTVWLDMLKTLSVIIDSPT